MDVASDQPAGGGDQRFGFDETLRFEVADREHLQGMEERAEAWPSQCPQKQQVASSLFVAWANASVVEAVANRCVHRRGRDETRDIAGNH